MCANGAIICNVFRLQNQIGDKNMFGAAVGEWSELRARLRENGARLLLT